MAAPRHSASRLTKKVAAFVEWERVARVATSGRSGIPHVVPVCPVLTGGRQHPSAPGLFFTGYRTELSGQMRLMRFDARSIARALTP